jgi:hypothetical protein
MPSLALAFVPRKRMGRRLGASPLIRMHHGSGPGSTEYKVVAQIDLRARKAGPCDGYPIASSVPRAHIRAVKVRPGKFKTHGKVRRSSF